MRDFIRSFFNYAWAMTVFSLRQIATGQLATGRFANGQITSGIVGTPGYPVPDRDPGAERAPETFTRAQSRPQSRPGFRMGRLDPERFVVLGEGLAAGMGEFTLYREAQMFSFPAQIARQMGIDFPQPLIQPPGICDAPGFERLPVIVPSPLQTTVLDELPPRTWANLSVPGMTVEDSVELRPREPLVNKSDAKQTAVNFIFGLDGMAYPTAGKLPTQLEAAKAQSPTLAIIELGYAEAIDAVVHADPRRLPSAGVFAQHYSRIVGELGAGGASVIVLTIPDPLDTAFVSTPGSASRLLKVDPDVIGEYWGVQPDDLITAPALNEMGFQIFNASLKPLPPGAVLPAGVAAEIRSRLDRLNQTIWQVAREQGAIVHDLHFLIQRVRSAGVNASRHLTAEYLGGFYSLNGYYPGGAGQAVIANDIIDLLNREFDARIPSIDLNEVIAADPVAAYKPPGGPNWTRHQLSELLDYPIVPQPAGQPRWEPAATPPPVRRLPLTLPPGLEQVLPLNPALSYFGDAITPMNCRSPETAAFGTSGHLLFGGFAMVDSHLTGQIRISFSPPVNGCSDFRISFEDGLIGDDQVLAAPRFFRMGFRRNRVDDIPGFVSSGTLNLNTGEVDTSRGALNIFARYTSTALRALISVNPRFPLPPQAPLSFPGQYGAACARFDQRPDGLLDFTFNGTTFVPLGDGTSWPLNFTGPSFEFATIPANGTVLHPHLALSTRETAPAGTQSDGMPEAPVNALEELTLFAPVSSFGDVFTLEAPQLGGPATGRSRLLGRAQIQFGPRCGDTIPVAIATSSAGGKLGPLEPTPISQLFPGRLTPGPHGFNENLRFPLRTYSLDDLAIIDDPFDIAVGLMDANTGRLVHPLLHRGFINQDLIFALIRVEPCTPQNSFLFRGPAEFRRLRSGKAMYHFYGQVHIPYPPGFLFPDPNLSTGFPIGGNSALDPYLWFWAIPEEDYPDRAMEMGGEAVSSRGERFTYRVSIPGKNESRRAEFEYENRSQNGRFRMHSLAWIAFAHSNTEQPGDGEPDTISFTGFGVWSKDGVERVLQASVQICTSRKAKYVGIQISPGDVSNVNTTMPAGAFPVEPPQPGGYECCIGLPPQQPQTPPAPRACPPPQRCGAGA